MEVPERVRKVIELAVRNCSCALATSDKDGKPNVVPVGYAKVLGDLILLADFYFTKTRGNVGVNPKVAISFGMLVRMKAIN